MGSAVSGFFGSMYDSRRREFLGRDGAGWGKLGTFYFFFYLGLAGFFCAMLAVFMAMAPRDAPRYVADESQMRTRSHPLSPGLGFRPQPDVEKHTVYIDAAAANDEKNVYVRNLDIYLKHYYPSKSQQKTSDDDHDDDAVDIKEFTISNPGDCTSANRYGFKSGKPCVLVKMNKIVGFIPQPVAADSVAYSNGSLCREVTNAIGIHCQGEYPADGDNMGDLTFISEKTVSNQCGQIETSWFPYNGKKDRKDVYQAPYVWVQFNNPKPNVLINVLCRAVGENIDVDRKTGRGLTRFQIYVEKPKKQSSSRKAGDM